MSDGSLNAASLNASSLGGADRPSRSYGTDRTCREPSCETLLSRYNQGKYCYLHEPMSVPRTRGKKIA